MSNNLDSTVNNGLYELLCEWNLGHLYNHFMDHRITIDALKIIKPKHIDILFDGLAVGDLILFEHHLENWKQKNVNEIPQNHSPITPAPKLELKNKISVMTILNETYNGKSILKYYEEKKVLHEEQRQLLIKTIASYVEATGTICSVSDCSEMEKEICSIFPTEELEYYNTGKRGKLYSKIYNLRRHSKHIFDLKESSNETDTEFVTESDSLLAVQHLRSGNVTADEFDIFWKKCAQYRFKQMKESLSTADILKDWPEYLRPSGFKLIEIDFELKYPQAKQLISKWPVYENKILHVLKTKIASAAVSKQLVEISSIDEESKQFNIFWHLHNLFPPQQKCLTDESGAKIKKKFSILDSQESFAIIASSEKEMEIKLELLKLRNLSIQPLLLILGSLSKIDQLYIYFDDMKYPILKIVTAVDILFKIFFVFNLEFPKESEIFYNFLQIFFYEMQSDKKFTKIYTIKNEILNSC